jgi:hypothetical protein
LLTPSVAIRDFPHNLDREILDEEYDRLPPFLQSVENVREREWANGNGEFFHIVAAQWMELASVQYVFRHQPAEIMETVKRGLKDVVLGLELGHGVEPPTALEYFSAALAVNDLPCAQFIASAPEDLLGCLNDPDSPLPEFTRASFVLFCNQDTELQSILELLHGLLFENPEDETPPLLKSEMNNLFHLIALIHKKDTAEFNKRLLERCQIRVNILNQEVENDSPSVIDWTALGFICLARDRGLSATVQNIYLPLAVLRESAHSIRSPE